MLLWALLGKPAVSFPGDVVVMEEDWPTGTDHSDLGIRQMFLRSEGVTALSRTTACCQAERPSDSWNSDVLILPL